MRKEIFDFVEKAECPARGDFSDKINRRIPVSLLNAHNLGIEIYLEIVLSGLGRLQTEICSSLRIGPFKDPVDFDIFTGLVENLEAVSGNRIGIRLCASVQYRGLHIVYFHLNIVHTQARKR